MKKKYYNRINNNIKVILSNHKKHRKTAIILLTLCITTISLLSQNACSTNNTAASDTVNKTAKASEVRNMDLGGKEIKIGSYGQSFNPKIDGSTTQKVLYSRIIEAEKLYNCKISYGSYYNLNSFAADIAKLYTDVSAGTSVYDIIQILPDNAFPYIVIHNIAVPLDSYIDFIKGIYSDPVQNVSIWNGKHYGLFWDIYHSSNFYLRYNKTMLDSQGLEYPQELLFKNQWDWDTFLKMAQKCTRDIDGDGIIDVWGVIDKSAMEWLFACLISNNGAIARIENGKAVYKLNTKESTAAIDFFISLYKEYKVVRNSFKYYNYDSSYQSKTYEDFITKRQGAFYIYTAGVTYDIEGNIFESVLFPKGRNADKYYTYIPYNFLMVPSTVKNPDQIARILEYICSVSDLDKEEHNTFDGWSESLVNLDEKYGYGDYALMIKMVNENAVFTPYTIYPLGLQSLLHKEITLKVLKDEETKDGNTIAADLKEQMQSEIDNFGR